MNQALGLQTGGLPGHLSGSHQGLSPPCPFHFPAWAVGRRGAGMVWEAPQRAAADGSWPRTEHEIGVSPGLWGLGWAPGEGGREGKGDLSYSCPGPLLTPNLTGTS